MIQVSKENFEEEVLKATQPVIVDFWGPSCQPCLKLMPEVERLAEAFKDRVKIVKINSAENRRLCIEHRVMGLPAFLVFKNGQEVARVAGQHLTVQDIRNLIDDIA